MQALMDLKPQDLEIMAPVGSWESLAAAVKAGAGAVYFGVGRLNMRAHSSTRFTLDDLGRIASACAESGTRSYLALNTIIYDGDMEEMRAIALEAKGAGVSAVIASDVAVMAHCRDIGMEVHLSTQLNISNIEALAFYARFADVAVLARELSLEQVKAIHEKALERDLRGPSGRPVRIEMFCHGALCMAVSGKCYLSLDNEGRSANRGECMQLCRRSYTVTDRETGTQLDIDNKYIMSPKDLKTIRFIDRMVDAGVRVFKIEGRARGPEYVYKVVRCYSEALGAVLDGTFTEERKDGWDKRLATVFNRGFWDGYYLGQALGQWNTVYGSSATERKVYVGKATNFFSRLGVAEFSIEAAEVFPGDSLLATGPTTGVVFFQAGEMRDDLGRVETARKGERVSMTVPERVRAGDKLFKIVRDPGQGGK